MIRPAGWGRFLDSWEGARGDPSRAAVCWRWVGRALADFCGRDGAARPPTEGRGRGCHPALPARSMRPCPALPARLWPMRGAAFHWRDASATMLPFW